MNDRSPETSSCGLSLNGFVFHSSGMAVDGAPSLEDWKTVGAFLKQAEGAVHWWIGDWLNYGESRWGEKYTQAIEETGFNYQTLANDKWVASKVEFSRRRENLSWSHHAEVANLESAEQEEWLEEAQKGKLSTRELRLAIKRAPHEEAIPECCTINDLRLLIAAGKRFGTIYADPPWKYSNQGTRASTDNHYQTMTVEEIAALPVAELSADNAHLHLWTTNAFLPESFRIIEAWGFEYKSLFIWTKPQMGIGNYWRVSAEILLLGVRGGCPFRDHSLPNWGTFDRGKHSVKPEAVRHMVERVSPGPYLELFGRRPMDGWAVWGNEIARGMFDSDIPEVA